MIAPIVHRCSERVRYADTDKMGIVYNGNYARFFEIGRTELLRAIGLPYVELEQAGILLPVLALHVEYLSPARYDDVLTIETHYQHEPTVATIRLSYAITCNGVHIANGYTKHSFVLADSWRPTRPPALFVNAVLNHQPHSEPS
jgi:acyl-CoA thioester hydrolase